MTSLTCLPRRQAFPGDREPGGGGGLRQRGGLAGPRPAAALPGRRVLPVLPPPRPQGHHPRAAAHPRLRARAEQRGDLALVTPIKYGGYR